MKPTKLCKNLRTKKMFIPALANEAFAGETPDEPHSAHCWCNCTLTETGPDDGPVGTERCTPERSCFEE
jgi:hypothetical protein